MAKVEKRIQNFEGRRIKVLFVHRCRAKTNAGIARLLNSKYLEYPLHEFDELFTADDVADMIRIGFLEQHDGYIYLLSWF